MKKLQFAVVALAILAFPFSAQAKTCFWGSCNYVEDGAFVNSGTYWTEASTTYPTVTGCTSLGSTIVAQVGNSGYVEQTFEVDSSYTSYNVDFRAFLLNDTDNWYDQLKVTVTNLDTNQSEVFYLRGSSYTTSCNLNSFTLSNDYDNATVKVRFDVSYSTLGTWQVDDVAFWGNPF